MVTSELKEYVRQRDIGKVRKELLAILNANPDMGDGQFDENLNYALNKLEDAEVFAPYSNEFESERKDSKEEWTTSYVAKIYLQLRKEFSKELISHLKKVAPVAYSEKAAQRDLLQQAAQKAENLPENAEENGSCRAVCATVIKWAIAAAVIICLTVIGINIF